MNGKKLFEQDFSLARSPSKGERKALFNLLLILERLVDEDVPRHLAYAVEHAWVADALGPQAFHQALMAEGVTQEQIDTIIPVEALERLYTATVAGASLEALRATHTQAPETEGAEPTLDESAYRQDMRDTVTAAQPVDQATVAALAQQRAEAIRASLVEQGGLDTGRIRIAPEPISEPVDGNWVRCQLEVAPE